MVKAAARSGRPTRLRVVVRVRPSIAEDVDLGAEFSQSYDECVVEDAGRGTVQLRNCKALCSARTTGPDRYYSCKKYASQQCNKATGTENS